MFFYFMQHWPFLINFSILGMQYQTFYAFQPFDI